jgi:hypothetical protein
MSQFRDTPDLPVTAAEALAAHRLVMFDSNGAAVYADATDKPLGVAPYYVAKDAQFSMQLLNKMGTIRCVAGEAISARADVYCGDDGKLTATDTGNVRVGIALEAATADGDVIEVLLL